MPALRDIRLRLRALHRAWRLRIRTDSAQVHLMLRHLRRGDVAVDVGSHKGGFTYWMRKAVGPTGNVYAFEPQPESAAYQREIARALGLDNVVVEALALSSSRGTAIFSAIPGGFHPGARIGPPRPTDGETAFQVETETLDHYFDSARRPVSLVKIDAEGHECEILRGALRILTEDRPVLIVECERRRHEGRTVWPTLDSILGLGYRGSFIHHSKLVGLSHFDEEILQIGYPYEVVDFAFFPRRPQD